MAYFISKHRFKLLLASIAIVMMCLGGIVLSTAQSTPSYIPRTTLFTPPEVLAIKISPDTKFLAYVMGEPSGVMNLYICPIDVCQDKHSLKKITHFTRPEIYRFFWTGDSKHIVFLQDETGSKSYHIYSVDIDSEQLTHHTQNFKNITAKIFSVSGDKVAVGINDRNPYYHDIYILDINTGTLIKIFENDHYSRFIFDENLNIVLKEKVHEDGSIDIYRNDRVYFHFSPEDAFHSHMLNIQNSVLYYVASTDSDTTWLKSIDLVTGEKANLAHNAKSDIGDLVFIDGLPAMYSSAWLKKEWHRLGAENFDVLQQKLGTSFEIISQSADLWVIRSTEPTRIGASFYLYNRNNEQIESLYLAKTDPLLADMIPFEFKTRDGLTLTAYITLPHQIQSIDEIKKPIPLIVFPHGGPFQARDTWSYNPYHQWLASRGYAVLSVNFRSSSGLGKKLVNAGNGEMGRKALLDLIDGVQWCIDHGITSKRQVGIMGASYGGYQTLAGLAFTPQVFAVGVDIVGPSSLLTVMQHIPQYWDFPSYPLSDTELLFTRGAFIKSMNADPADPVGRQLLENRSPLNFTSQFKSPVLIIQGDQDPIVTRQESLQIFSALKKLKKNTLLLTFSDEGHQFRRYANIDVFLAYAEKWLHDSLGGEYEPMDPSLMKESSVMIHQ